MSRSPMAEVVPGERGEGPMNARQVWILECHCCSVQVAHADLWEIREEFECGWTDVDGHDYCPACRQPAELAAREVEIMKPRQVCYGCRGRGKVLTHRFNKVHAETCKTCKGRGYLVDDGTLLKWRRGKEDGL